MKCVALRYMAIDVMLPARCAHHLGAESIADSMLIRFLSDGLLVRVCVRGVFRWFRYAPPSAIEIRGSTAKYDMQMRFELVMVNLRLPVMLIAGRSQCNSTFLSEAMLLSSGLALPVSSHSPRADPLLTTMLFQINAWTEGLDSSNRRMLSGATMPER